MPSVPVCPAAVKTSRPPATPARSYRVVCAPAIAGGPVFVELTADGQATEYRIEEYPGADFGRGFEVVKVSGEDAFRSYDVNVDRVVSTCECWGHLRWSQRGDCRHIWLLKEMMKDNVIRPRPRPIPFPKPPRPAAVCGSAAAGGCGSAAADAGGESLRDIDLAEDRQRRLADL
jgi:hypothetical protein